MQNQNDEKQQKSQFSNKNRDTDISGQKGGTSQQGYQDSSTSNTQSERGRDEEMSEDTKSW